MMQISKVGQARFNDRIYTIGETDFRIKQYTQISNNIFWGEAVFLKMFPGKESLIHV